MLLSASVAGQDVVVLLGSSADPYRAAAEACEKELRSRGKSSQTFTVDEAADVWGRSSAGEAVYVTVGAKAALIASREAPDSARIVHCMASSYDVSLLPRRSGLGGVTTTVPASDQFRFIGEVLPRARRIGVVHRSGSATSRFYLAEAEAALPRGWELESVDLDAAASVAAAIDDLLSRDVDIVWTFADVAVFDSTTVRALLLAALRSETAVFGFSPLLVKAGALAGVGIGPSSQGERAAEIAFDTLTRPGEAPTNRTPTFQTSVNLVVAQKLGLRLSPDVTDAVDEVFR